MIKKSIHHCSPFFCVLRVLVTLLGPDQWERGMSVMGVYLKTLRLLKRKHLRDISASCLSGGNELCALSLLLELWETQLHWGCEGSRCLLIPPWTPQSSDCVPAGTGLCQEVTFELECPSVILFPVSDGTLLPPSLFLEDLGFLCSPIQRHYWTWGWGSFEAVDLIAHICVLYLLPVSSPRVEEKDPYNWKASYLS